MRQSSEVLRQARKRLSKRIIALVAARLAKAGVHPISFRRFFTGMGRGRFVLDHKKFTSDPPPLPADTPVALGNAGADDLFGGGWHAAEDGGRWSSGPSAELFFSIEDGCQGGTVELCGRPLRDGDQVTLTINNNKPRIHTFGGDDPVRLTLDSPGAYCLEIRVDDPTTPQALSVSDDTRTLGFFVSSLRLLSNTTTA